MEKTLTRWPVFVDHFSDESVNASIDGAAFRVGAGVQADITKNMGAYASLDYTKGDDIENPLQGVVGINVTW
ncbi:autotransporter outer membrane beta-barrel domain-containing protein [Escherichia coli]|nr:autotransporter outer membrane beta-barrel domain-containing protein [Escherichia coli]